MTTTQEDEGGGDDADAHDDDAPGHAVDGGLPVALGALLDRPRGQRGHRRRRGHAADELPVRHGDDDDRQLSLC